MDALYNLLYMTLSVFVFGSWFTGAVVGVGCGIYIGGFPNEGSRLLRTCRDSIAGLCKYVTYLCIAAFTAAVTFVDGVIEKVSGVLSWLF